MDVNIINPLFDAFQNILPQLGFAQVTNKRVFHVEALLHNPGVIVNISLTGQLKGVILISMTTQAANNIASKMMMGMAVTTFDPLAQSAISEFGNMVCANACTQFANNGVSGLDISPPTLLVGEGGQVMLSVPKVIAVSLEADGICFEVYAAITKDKQ